jgi:hypothetical protein
LNQIRKEEIQRHKEGGFMRVIKQIGRFSKAIGEKNKEHGRGFAMVGAGALRRSYLG